MTRYGMVIDETLCNGCYSCFLACRDEFCGNDYQGYSAPQPMAGMNWMRIVEKERGRYPKVKVAYTSILCSQCADAPCVQKAAGGSVYQRDDGIVLIDPEKAVGQKQILNSCPYRLIDWKAALQPTHKGTFCAHLLDRGWKEPRCAEACPTRAIVFGDLDDPDSEVSRLLNGGKTRPLNPEYRLGEKVAYIGLPAKFIAGSVVFGDTGRCASDVSVMVSDAGSSEVTRTNNYGDFEVDGLADNAEYLVTIEAPEYEAVQLTTRTIADIYLGDIVLTKSGTLAGAGR